jgi:hypothetical protein
MTEQDTNGDPVIALEDPSRDLRTAPPITDGPLSSLDEEQRRRVGALNMARPLITDKSLLGAYQAPDVDELIRLAQWILSGKPEELYPFVSGDVLVLGPEIFVGIDGKAVCWRGSNYYLDPEDR